jgi:hypothetical protein
MIKSVLRNIVKYIPERLKIGGINLLYSSTKNRTPKYDMFYHINLLKKLGFNPSFIIDVGGYQGEWTKNVLTIFQTKNF